MGQQPLTRCRAALLQEAEQIAAALPGFTPALPPASSHSRLPSHSWLMRGKIKLHCDQHTSGYLVPIAPPTQGQPVFKTCLLVWTAAAGWVLWEDLQGSMPQVLGAERGWSRGLPCPALGVVAVMKEAVGWAHIFITSQGRCYPQASAMTVNDGLIKCCRLLRAGHMHRNCGVFKPLPQHPGRLEAHLQLVLLLKPEKGESNCKTCMCFTSQKQPAGASPMQRSSSRD